MTEKLPWNKTKKNKKTVSHKLANFLEIQKIPKPEERKKCYVFWKKFGQDAKILQKKKKKTIAVGDLGTGLRCRNLLNQLPQQQLFRCT